MKKRWIIAGALAAGAVVAYAKREQIINWVDDRLEAFDVAIDDDDSFAVRDDGPHV